MRIFHFEIEYYIPAHDQTFWKIRGRSGQGQKNLPIPIFQFSGRTTPIISEFFNIKHSSIDHVLISIFHNLGKKFGQKVSTFLKAFILCLNHPDYFAKLDFEIAVDQQTRARDRTFEGVPDSG